jgi:hypothetical protein
MRHTIPQFVVALGALATAVILLPAGLWGRYPAFSVPAVVLTCLPCYWYGFSRESEYLDAGPSERRGLQFSLGTMLIVTTLVSISLGFYCGRDRQQMPALVAIRQMESESQRSLSDGGMVMGGGNAGESPPDHVLVRASNLEEAMPYLERLACLRCVTVTVDDTWNRTRDGGERVRLYFRAQKAARDACERLKRELPHVRIEVKNRRHGPEDVGAIPVVG